MMLRTTPWAAEYLTPDEREAIEGLGSAAIHCNLSTEHRPSVHRPTIYRAVVWTADGRADAVAVSPVGAAEAALHQLEAVA